METRSCPDCGWRCAPRERVCTRCGAPISRAQAKGAARESREVLGGLLGWIVSLLPALYRPRVLVAGALATGGGLLCMWASLASPIGSCGLALVAWPGALVLYGSGICWLLHGEVAFPLAAMADFRARHWAAFVLLMMLYPACSVLTFLYLISGQQ